MNAFPQHSKAPWGEDPHNAGSITDANNRVVAFVLQADDQGATTTDGYERLEAECRANKNVIRYAPALLANLRYAVWCFVEGVAPTADAIGNMLTAAALASGEDVVTFGPRVGAEGGVA